MSELCFKRAIGFYPRPPADGRRTAEPRAIASEVRP
jgi:hypothetical protein